MFEYLPSVVDIKFLPAAAPSTSSPHHVTMPTGFELARLGVIDDSEEESVVSDVDESSSNNGIRKHFYIPAILRHTITILYVVPRCAAFPSVRVSHIQAIAGESRRRRPAERRGLHRRPHHRAHSGWRGHPGRLPPHRIAGGHNCSLTQIQIFWFADSTDTVCIQYTNIGVPKKFKSWALFSVSFLGGLSALT